MELRAQEEGPVQMMVGLALVDEEQALVGALGPVLGPPRAHYHRRQGVLVV